MSLGLNFFKVGGDSLNSCRASCGLETFVSITLLIPPYIIFRKCRTMVLVDTLCHMAATRTDTTPSLPVPTPSHHPPCRHQSTSTTTPLTTRTWPTSITPTTTNIATMDTSLTICTATDTVLKMIGMIMTTTCMMVTCTMVAMKMIMSGTVKMIIAAGAVTATLTRTVMFLIIATRYSLPSPTTSPILYIYLYLLFYSVFNDSPIVTYIF